MPPGFQNGHLHIWYNVFACFAFDQAHVFHVFHVFHVLHRPHRHVSLPRFVTGCCSSRTRSSESTSSPARNQRNWPPTWSSFSWRVTRWGSSRKFYLGSCFRSLLSMFADSPSWPVSWCGRLERNNASPTLSEDVYLFCTFGVKEALLYGQQIRAQRKVFSLTPDAKRENRPLQTVGRCYIFQNVASPVVLIFDSS